MSNIFVASLVLRWRHELCFTCYLGFDYQIKQSIIKVLHQKDSSCPFLHKVFPVSPNITDEMKNNGNTCWVKTYCNSKRISNFYVKKKMMIAQTISFTNLPQNVLHNSVPSDRDLPGSSPAILYKSFHVLPASNRVHQSTDIENRLKLDWVENWKFCNGVPLGFGIEVPWVLWLHARWIYFLELRSVWYKYVVRMSLFVEFMRFCGILGWRSWIQNVV